MPASVTHSTPTGDARSKGAMSIPEGARYCSINEYFLYRLIARGEGPRVVRIGRRILLRQADLDAWLESRVEVQQP